MTYRIVVTARARADAIEAFRWIAERSPDAAARWYAGVQKALAKLSKLPELNPVAEEESEQVGITLRQMLYGRRPNVYRILYSVEGDTVNLHYVRHSAQGPIEP
jgi:toxin ParE1/3/4